MSVSDDLSLRDSRNRDSCRYGARRRVRSGARRDSAPTRIQGAQQRGKAEVERGEPEMSGHAKFETVMRGRRLECDEEQVIQSPTEDRPERNSASLGQRGMTASIQRESEWCDWNDEHDRERPRTRFLYELHPPDAVTGPG
jgi:hypothetical protein